MTIMVNIITVASKTESLLSNVSLLRFGTTAKGTVANLKSSASLKFAITFFDPASENPRGSLRRTHPSRPLSKKRCSCGLLSALVACWTCDGKWRMIPVRDIGWQGG
jgi:hypothetical protein